MNRAQPLLQLDTPATGRQPPWHWWLLATGLPLLAIVEPALERGALALGVVLLYTAFTGLIWRQHRRRHSVADVAASDTTLIAYASQSGAAQRLAELTATELERSGTKVTLLSLAQLEPASLAGYGRALFIVSTYGEGEAPDNGVRFDNALQRRAVDCAGLDYAVLALGDRHYRHYCAFGRRIAARLDQLGANPLFDTIEINAQSDRDTERALQQWQLQIVGSVPANAAAWHLPEFEQWRLTGRRHLNPGSPGASVFLVTLEPAATEPNWQAGDIAEILPGPATTTTNLPPHRDYSIASLPASGTLQLVVRQQHGPDGELGLGSGWLTARAPLGDPIALRIRVNPAFHAPAPTRPLILIGNGTGWAGLRAHLLARPAHSRNWLLFGERSPQHDDWVAAELQLLQLTDRVERTDFAFSRAVDAPCYVQQRLRAAAPQLLEWVAAGAAIYVCGSASGMAQEVDAALRDILGAQLDQLVREERYRRDVY